MKIARRKPQANVPTTAVGDVVFNLLIFFLVLMASQMTPSLKWEPAEGEQLEKFAATPANVSIDSDGRIFFNSEKTSTDRLPQQLSATLEGLPAGKRTVLLRVHKSTESTIFEPVIEAIGQAGGNLVHVLEQETNR